MKNPFWMLRSWFGWVNFFLLQWFFVRLMEVGETDANGKWLHYRWELLWAPLPLTGWWFRYIFIYKGPAARRITHVPRYVFLKKRLLKCLDGGPKSAFALERYMKDEGFRTSRVIHQALAELVEAGEISVMAKEAGKAWLYKRVGRTV